MTKTIKEEQVIITDKDKLLLVGLMTLAIKARKTLEDCEREMNSLAKQKDKLGTHFGDGIFNYDEALEAVESAIEKSEIKVVKDKSKKKKNLKVK